MVAHAPHCRHVPTDRMDVSDFPRGRRRVTSVFRTEIECERRRHNGEYRHEDRIVAARWSASQFGQQNTPAEGDDELATCGSMRPSVRAKLLEQASTERSCCPV